MSILKLISSDSFIMTSQALIDEFGLIEANIIGLFASTDNYNSIKDPNYDGWFYVTYDKIEKRLKLSQYVAQKPIDRLVENGVLLVKREGIPLQKYFKFNQQKLLDVLLPRNSMTRNEETRLQENEELDDKEINNSIASDEEALQQGAKKLGSNKNTDNNTNKNLSLLPTLEDCEAHAEKEKFPIDVEKFFKFYFVDSNKKYRSTWQQLMRTWAEKPSNQIIKIEKQSAKIAPTESEEIKNLRTEIRTAISRSGDMQDYRLFQDKLIEKTSYGFVIKVDDERALKYQSVLEKIKVKIEVK